MDNPAAARVAQDGLANWCDKMAQIRAAFPAGYTVTPNDLDIELEKRHKASWNRDLLRTLLTDLRLGRVDLKEFCKRLGKHIGAEELIFIYRAAQKKRPPRLQQQELRLTQSEVVTANLVKAQLDWGGTSSKPRWEPGFAQLEAASLGQSAAQTPPSSGGSVEAGNNGKRMCPWTLEENNELVTWMFDV